MSDSTIDTIDIKTGIGIRSILPWQDQYFVLILYFQYFTHWTVVGFFGGEMRKYASNMHFEKCLKFFGSIFIYFFLILYVYISQPCLRHGPF